MNSLLQPEKKFPFHYIFQSKKNDSLTLKMKAICMLTNNNNKESNKSMSE